MRKQVFVSLTAGLMTAWTTPVILGQAAFEATEQLDHQEHHLKSQDFHAAKDSAECKNVRASKLIGIRVTSKQGENLGQVQDIVFNPATGQIRFALVGQGFMAGLGEKLIPVPWEAVKVKSEQEFALNVDKAKMTSAPAWSQSEEDQPDYVIRVYRFYQLEPGDEIGVGGSGQSGLESGQGQGSSSDDNSSTPNEIPPKDNAP